MNFIYSVVNTFWSMDWDLQDLRPFAKIKSKVFNFIRFTICSFCWPKSWHTLVQTPKTPNLANTVNFFFCINILPKFGVQFWGFGISLPSVRKFASTFIPGYAWLTLRIRRRGSPRVASQRRAPQRRRGPPARPRAERRRALPVQRKDPERPGHSDGVASESVGWQNFGKMLLVFGCIVSDFCKENMR